MALFRIDNLSAVWFTDDDRPSFLFSFPPRIRAFSFAKNVVPNSCILWSHLNTAVIKWFGIMAREETLNCCAILLTAVKFSTLLLAQAKRAIYSLGPSPTTTLFVLYRMIELRH